MLPLGVFQCVLDLSNGLSTGIINSTKLKGNGDSFVYALKLPGS
jgi:hypothetical protein